MSEVKILVSCFCCKHNNDGSTADFLNDPEIRHGIDNKPEMLGVLSETRERTGGYQAQTTSRRTSAKSEKNNEVKLLHIASHCV